MSTTSVNNICPVCHNPVGNDHVDSCVYFSAATAGACSGTDKAYIKRSGGKALKGVVHRDCWNRIFNI